MKIYPVYSCLSNMTFKSCSNRRCDAGVMYDIPTVKDLYDMEDRLLEKMNKIISYQDNRFQNQNSALADVFTAQTQLLLSAKSNNKYLDDKIDNLNASISVLNQKRA